MKRDRDSDFLGIPFLREGLHAFADELNGIWYGTTHTDQAIRYYFKRDGIREGTFKAAFSKVVYQLVRHKRLLETYTGVSQTLDSRSMNELISAWDLLFQSGSKSAALAEHLPDSILTDPSVLYSWHPKIWNLLQEQYADDWIPMARKLNDPPQMHLRVNTLLSTKEEVMSRLKEEQISFAEDEEAGNGIRLSSPFDFFSSSIFNNGAAEMQDVNSQLVAPFCDVEPGMRVIDTCAGAGGKSLHLAALMKNKGRILSLDVAEKKLLELKKRAARANVQIIESRRIESTKTTKRLNGSADVVLIDAPCSGTGVVRRNPELKWRTDPDQLKRFSGHQEELLDRYSKLAKPGGKVIFAVCSLFLEEGEKISSGFISRHPEWKLIKEKRTSPLKNDADGFYFASFRRNT